MLIDNVECNNINKIDKASQQITKMFLVEFLEPLVKDMSNSLNINEGVDGELYTYLLQEAFGEQITANTYIKDVIKKYLISNYAEKSRGCGYAM